MSGNEANTGGHSMTSLQSLQQLPNSYSGQPLYSTFAISPRGLPARHINQTPASRQRASKASIEAMPKVTVAYEDGKECSICLNGFKVDDQVKETPCKHTFHGACIEKWMAMSNLCPLCRFSLPAESEDEQYHFAVETEASPVNYLELDEMLFGSDPFLDL